MAKDKIAEVIREAFADKANLAETAIVGSGISENVRAALNIFHAPERLAELPGPWVENRAMIARLFGPVFERRAQCPGKDRPQCCQAEPPYACYPNWREREDPEWYAWQIHAYLSQVEERLRNVTSDSAAQLVDAAFELGCLVTEALIKFRWDDHAKRGLKTKESARVGGEAKRRSNERRKNVEQTVAAVAAHLAQGKRKMDAYRAVAKEQGVTEQTIRKEFQAAKKLR